MATLEKIRSKGGLLVGAVGFALLAFIVGDFLNSGSSYFNKSREVVGKIAGEEFNIKDFSAAIDQMTEVYKIETGRSELNEDMTAQLRQSVWENLVSEKLLQAEGIAFFFVYSCPQKSEKNNIKKIQINFKKWQH